MNCDKRVNGGYCKVYHHLIIAVTNLIKFLKLILYQVKPKKPYFNLLRNKVSAPVKNDTGFSWNEILKKITS